MKKFHKRTESLTTPTNSQNSAPFSKRDLNSRIKCIFFIDDFSPILSANERKSFENYNITRSVRQKAQISQKFYQDGSSELCEQIEKLLSQNLKSLLFSTAFKNILQSSNRDSFLYDEISSLLREEDFRYKLQILLLKIRNYEEISLFSLTLCSLLQIKPNENLEIIELLLILKEKVLINLQSFFLDLMFKGLKLILKSEILNLLFQNTQNKDFIDQISFILQSNNEKLLIDLIKSLKYDSHSEIVMFEQLIILVKRQEINEFFLKLLLLFKETETNGSAFHESLKESLKNYDFKYYEDFLEKLLEIMNECLSETSHYFQEKIHDLIMNLQMSGVLSISLESDPFINNTRESFESCCENPLQTKSDYEKVLCKTKKYFSDELFVADFSSLVNNVKKPQYKLWRDIFWVRLQDLFKGCLDLPLYNKAESVILSPNDIPHKYIYTVLESIKEQPWILRNIFEKQTINKKGVYFVKICQDGVWRYIILDEFLPCVRNKDKISNAFLIVKSSIWPLLIEKALAKVYHSYQSLELGNSIETLRDLTGAPFTKIHLSEREEKYILPQLKKFIDLHFVVLLKVSTMLCKSLNLDSAYECQLMKIYDRNENSREIMEIKIPNNFESLLKLSKSPSNTQRANENNTNNNNNNSIILVDSKEFFKIFSYVHISKLHKDYFYVTSPINHLPSAYSIRSFELSHPGQCYIEISQLDKRYFRNLPSYSYAFTRLLIAKRTNLYENSLNSEEKNSQCSFVYIDSIAETQRNTHLDLYLDSGVYYIIISLDYANRKFDSCLSYYGEENIVLERENFRGNAAVFEEIMKEISIKYGRKIALNEGLSLYNYISVKDALVLEYYSNESKKTYKLRRNYREKNIIGYDNEKKQFIDLQLKSGEDKTLIFKYNPAKNSEVLYKELTEEYLQDFKEMCFF